MFAEITRNGGQPLLRRQTSRSKRRSIGFSETKKAFGRLDMWSTTPHL